MIYYEKFNFITIKYMFEEKDLKEDNTFNKEYLEKTYFSQFRKTTVRELLNDLK